MTKKLTPILLLCLLASCETKENTESNEVSSINFSYELDTVMVDPGDQFIHLNWQLTTSDLSSDEKYFYNFKTGGNPIGVEVIDLENLKLERVIPMSLDGPNGISSPYMSNFYILPDGTFYLTDSREVYHFDQEGNKLSDLVYSKQEFEGEKLPEGKKIKFGESLSKDGKRLVILYGGEKMTDPAEGLALFNLEKRTVQYKPLDVFKELDKYQSALFTEGDLPLSMILASVYPQQKNDSLLYSNTAQNKIYFYHLKTDSLSSKSYSSKFTSQEAPGSYQKRTESEEEFQEIMKEQDKEVMYGGLFFDSKNDVYWRFAKEMDRMKGDTIQYKTVLTAFDPAFNQIHEQLLPTGFVLPYKYFVRDGMIYTFLNIEDELAFVRLKPNFGND